MKRFGMVFAVVGMVVLFAPYAMGFFGWAPFAVVGWRFFQQRIK